VDSVADGEQISETGSLRKRCSAVMTVFLVICTVRDMSPVGAGLLLDGVSPRYLEFALTFDRVPRRCVAVWRHLGRMGLKFEPI
jgi:hypothetical protein